MTDALPRFTPRTPRRACTPVRAPRATSRRRPTTAPVPFEPSKLPFDMLKALSLNPALLRCVSRLLLLTVLIAPLARAAETPTAPAAPLATNAAPAADQKAIPANAEKLATPAPASVEAPKKDSAPAPQPATKEAPAEPAKPILRDTARATAPAPSAAAAGKTNVPLTNIEAFKLIADRNIFNQSRSPRVSSALRSSETNEVPRVPRIEAFALVGTMSFEKGDFAFFDSGNSQYRKTLKVGDEIAGHKLTEVKTTHATLVQGETKTELKVGQQLRREDDGPWQVTANTGNFASSSGGGSSSSSSSSGSSSGSSSAGGSASEILKRLMEQRARER